MIKKDIHLFTNLSKWMNIFYYCKKSDRVIGNRDLIANPFSQGYSRSDFDRILDHFLAKWSGFDCQSQKKWSVTTMLSTDPLSSSYWHSGVAHIEQLNTTQASGSPSVSILLKSNFTDIFLWHLSHIFSSSCFLSTSTAFSLLSLDESANIVGWHGSLEIVN